MTKVTILPVPREAGGPAFQAVAGARHSQGRTAGEALDALTAQFSEDEDGPLVVVGSLRPDRFFGAAQQQRLGELMAHWHAAREQGQALPPREQAELDALAESELAASAARAAALADQAGR